MRIGKVIADYRYANRLGVRELAEEIGLSSATLSRIENGHACDGKSIITILSWLFGPAVESRRKRQSAKEEGRTP